MKIHANPQIALCDEKVSIRVSGLPPQSPVKVSATMRLPWAPDVPFSSSACFQSDAGGQVDLATQTPSSGSYDFCDSMGLILSLMHTKGADLNRISQNIGVEESLFIDLTAESDGETDHLRLERRFKSPAVTGWPVNREFVGQFFSDGAPHEKTILVLGGSGGDLCANLPIAALLASRGYHVLTVAYFKEKGLPPALEQIPLEYFEKVFAWLKDNPLTRDSQLYLWCMSKGGELGLLLASRYPHIRRVAAFTPHAYCFQGLHFKRVSSWTYGGRDLPFIPLKNGDVLASLVHSFVKNVPFGFTPTYRKAVAAALDADAARIRIEEAHADLILFGGTADNIWNTCDACQVIMDRLKQAHYPHSYEFIEYPEAGHPFYAPYIIPAGENEVKIAPRLTASNGGSLRGNAFAIVDSWERCLAFFDRPISGPDLN